MIAKATLEGLLDAAIAAASRVFETIGTVIQDRPWLVVVLALFVGLFVFSRKH